MPKNDKNDRQQPENVTFARDLGFFDATMIGIGAMIGAGIFVLTGIAAGEAEVRKARAALLPQLAVVANGLLLDEDRAEASLGQQPERLWTGTAAGTQLIYSDKTWSNYSVQKHIQTGRQEERETVKLDIIQAATTAYLNFLRTKAIERIQKENLKLTRENLERTYVRRRRESWLEKDAKIAERSRDGFQRGFIRGMLGMAISGFSSTNEAMRDLLKACMRS